MAVQSTDAEKFSICLPPSASKERLFELLISIDDYWWMVGRYTNDEPAATDTDNWALANGYVAVTSICVGVMATYTL